MNEGAAIVGVAMGHQHGLALAADGNVTSWGKAYATPPGLSGVTAIAAGNGHSLALRDDGTVVAWGENSAGQASVPVGLSDVVAIDAGMAHSVALRSDGSVVAWGSNANGQCDVPGSLSGATAVTAGWWHNLALRGDGSVVAWGHPDSDQRHVPWGLTGAVGIAAGYENSSAIMPDGTVIDWGNDRKIPALLNPSDYEARSGPFVETLARLARERQALFQGVIAIAYGNGDRLVLRRDGTVFLDGHSGGIELPEDLDDVVAVAGADEGAGSQFLVLTRPGTVVPLGIKAFAEYPRPAQDVPWELTSPRTTDRRAADPDEATPAVRSQADLDDFDPTWGKTALMHWAAVGDASAVHALIQAGADVQEVDDDGDGALRYALTSRSSEVLALLIGAGADVDEASTTSGGAGFTVLHAYAEAGWVDGVRCLLSHGADANARGQLGATPVMLAAGAGTTLCVEELRRAGADVAAVDVDGDSVLYWAASRGRADTVARLLEMGADPDPTPGVSGHSPLTVAAQQASPMGRRPPDQPASDFEDVAVQLLLAGARPTAMYSAGLVMSKGRTIAPLSTVNRVVARHDGWSVSYLPPDSGLRSTAMW